MDIFNQVAELLKSGGWIGIYALAIYLAYKTTTISIIALAVFKAIKLIVVTFSSRTLESRIAAEMKTRTPLTPNEEKAVLAAVRNIDIAAI